MARKNDVKGADDSAPLVRKPRVAIVMKNFINSFNYAPHIQDKCFKQWSRGQIIFNEDEIQELLKLNAPIKVYVEDVD